MKLTTCQMKDKRLFQLDGWHVVDITVKSGDKAFAPRWDIVMGYKKGIVSPSQYFKTYRGMMRASVKERPFSWKGLLQHNKLALACYCPPGNFCHRYILAGFVTRYAKKNGVEVEIVPENRLSFGRECLPKPRTIQEGLSMCLDNGDFTVGSVSFKIQNPKGVSRLARTVRDGWLKAEQIAWCLKEIDNHPPIWRGCMIRMPNKDYCFNLQTVSGRKALTHWLDTFRGRKKEEVRQWDNLENPGWPRDDD